MRKPKSVKSLEELGRIRLSQSFYFRDFLYSEVSNHFGRPNVPDYPAVAVEALSRLCQDLLEPLNRTFGRITIFSGYRSPSVNALCNEKKLNCASNEANYAGHICDYRDDQGRLGATASIVIPWLADRCQKDGNWQEMAWWIHDHLHYHDMQFFPKLTAFNITWREQPERIIQSYIPPNSGILTKPGYENHTGDHSGYYLNYPALKE